MEQHEGVQFTHFQNSFEIAEHLNSMILFCLLIMTSKYSQVNEFSEFAVESKISYTGLSSLKEQRNEEQNNSKNFAIYDF